MAKNFPYFKFVATEWMTGDIVFESFSTQGLFVNICALYWQRNGELSVNDINKRFKNPVELAELTDRFFSVNDGLISIKFLDEQLIDANHISKVNSENGAKGGRPKKPIANPSLTDRKANESKEEKEEEVNNNESKVNKKFTPPTVLEVESYFHEKGYSIETARKAHEYYNVADWADSNGNKVKNWKQKMNSVWFKEDNKIKPIIAGSKPKMASPIM